MKVTIEHAAFTAGQAAQAFRRHAGIALHATLIGHVLRGMGAEKIGVDHMHTSVYDRQHWEPLWRELTRLALDYHHRRKKPMPRLCEPPPFDLAGEVV